MFFATEIEVIEKPLGIPYFRADLDSHSFVDLRHAAAIEQLPELKKRQALYDFVKAVNEPSSQFQTFGCETWDEPWEHPEAPGFVTRVGSYVDVTFANLILCRNQSLLRNLIRQFQKYGQECIAHNCSWVMFNLRRTVNLEHGQWWTLELWNYGIGRNRAEAEQWWADGLRCFQTFLLDRPETINTLKHLIITGWHHRPDSNAVQAAE